MAHLSSPAASCTSRAANVHQQLQGRRSRLVLARAPVVATSSRAPTPQHPAPSQRLRRQPVAAAAAAGGDGGSTGGSGSAASPGGPHGPAWLREQTAAMLAAWEELAPEERTWLQAQNAALAMQPITSEAAEEQQRLLQQCVADWNSFPPASQWRTAWADLLPQQQQDTMEQRGVATVEDLLPAIAAEHTSLPDDLRAASLKQLPPAAARLRVAAVILTEQLARKAAWAELAPQERRWLEAQEAAAAVQPESEEAAEEQRQQLQQLAEEWLAFPPDSCWRTAWADLIPSQQQQMLAQVGAGSVEEFVPALAALPPDQQASVMEGLTVPQQRVLAAAAGLQLAAGEGMPPDQLLWLQSLTTARSAQPASQQVEEQAAAIAAQLEDQWLPGMGEPSAVIAAVAAAWSRAQPWLMIWVLVSLVWRAARLAAIMIGVLLAAKWAPRLQAPAWAAFVAMQRINFGEYIAARALAHQAATPLEMAKERTANYTKFAQTVGHVFQMLQIVCLDLLLWLAWGKAAKKGLLPTIHTDVKNFHAGALAAIAGWGLNEALAAWKAFSDCHDYWLSP